MYCNTKKHLIKYRWVLATSWFLSPGWCNGRPVSNELGPSSLHRGSCTLHSLPQDSLSVGPIVRQAPGKEADRGQTQRQIRAATVSPYKTAQGMTSTFQAPELEEGSHFRTLYPFSHPDKKKKKNTPPWLLFLPKDQFPFSLHVSTPLRPSSCSPTTQTNHCAFSSVSFTLSVARSFSRLMRAALKKK